MYDMRHIKFAVSVTKWDGLYGVYFARGGYHVKGLLSEEKRIKVKGKVDIKSLVIISWHANREIDHITSHHKSHDNFLCTPLRG